MNVALLVSWFIVGLVHLFVPGEISKFSYFLIWITLLVKFAESIVV